MTQHDAAELPRRVQPDLLHRCSRSTLKISILATDAVLRLRLSGRLLPGLQGHREVEGDPAGADRRAQLHQLPDPHAGVAHPVGRQRRGLEVAAGRRHPQRTDQRARHQNRRADRDRLQLPRVHDPAVVRRARPHRRPHARGQQGPGGQSAPYVPAGHPAVGRPRHRGRRAADLHPDVWRLRHGHAARRHVGQHDRRDDRQPVPRRRRTGRSARRWR